MRKFLEHLLNGGIRPNIKESEKREIYILNYWNILAALVQVPYMLMAWNLGETRGLLMNIVFFCFAVIGYALTYYGKIKFARYWMLISFSFIMAFMNLYFGRDTFLLTIFVVLALAVAFFFDERREIWLLGAYVIVVALVSYFISETPLIANEPPSMTSIFATMNIIAAMALVIFFVRTLQKENIRFEDSIIQQNTVLSQQKEEIEAQRDLLSEMNHEVSHQNNSLNASNLLIARKNKTITDSIRYAQRIQTAIMPSAEELEAIFPESFIIYQPKDIIGGDFYWAEKTQEAIFLAVADCTGHGVPGALMSMLGANLLSQIITHTQDPSQILAELDQHIRKQLRQDDAHSDMRDGMDIAICRIDERQISMASAQRTVIMANEGQLRHIKGDKYPVGSGVYLQKNFTTHTFPRTEVQGIYLYTDGCTDLFDAQNTRKISQKRWLGWLEETAHLPIDTQEAALKERLAMWAGNTPPIDDLLLVHVRL